MGTRFVRIRGRIVPIKDKGQAKAQPAKPKPLTENDFEVAREGRFKSAFKKAFSYGSFGATLGAAAGSGLAFGLARRGGLSAGKTLKRMSAFGVAGGAGLGFKLANIGAVVGFIAPSYKIQRKKS